eukprot:363500-Chlamydomonas_euryale.AAC.8
MASGAAGLACLKAAALARPTHPPTLPDPRLAHNLPMSAQHLAQLPATSHRSPPLVLRLDVRNMLLRFGVRKRWCEQKTLSDCPLSPPHPAPAGRLMYLSA